MIVSHSCSRQFPALTSKGWSDRRVGKVVEDEEIRPFIFAKTPCARMFPRGVVGEVRCFSWFVSVFCGGAGRVVLLTSAAVSSRNGNCTVGKESSSSSSQPERHPRRGQSNLLLSQRRMREHKIVMPHPDAGGKIGSARFPACSVNCPVTTTSNVPRPASGKPPNLRIPAASPEYGCLYL